MRGLSAIEITCFLYLPSLFLFFARYLSITSITVHVFSTLALSEFHAGLAMSAVAIGKVLVDLPAGVFASKVNPSLCLIIASSIMTAASFILTQITTYPALVGSLVFFGCGMGIVQVLWQDLSIHRLSGADTSRVPASLGGVIRVAVVLASAASSFVFSLGLMFTIQTISAALISVTPVVMIIRQRISRLKSADVTPTSRGSNALQTLASQHSPGTSPRILRIVQAGTFMLSLQILRSCRTLVLPLVAKSQNWNSEAIGFLITTSYIFDLFCFAFAATIYKAKGFKFAAAVTTAVTAASLFLIATQNYYLLWLGGAVAGIGGGLGSGICLVIGSAIAQGSPSSSFASVWRLVIDVGELLGPLAAGALMHSMPLVFAFACVASISVTGVAVLYGISAIDKCATGCVEPDQTPASPRASCVERSEPLDYNQTVIG